MEVHAGYTEAFSQIRVARADHGNSLLPPNSRAERIQYGSEQTDSGAAAAEAGRRSVFAHDVANYGFVGSHSRAYTTKLLSPGFGVRPGTVGGVGDQIDRLIADQPEAFPGLHILEGPSR